MYTATPFFILRYILALAFVAFGWTFVDVAVEDIR